MWRTDHLQMERIVEAQEKEGEQRNGCRIRK